MRLRTERFSATDKNINITVLSHVVREIVSDSRSSHWEGSANNGRQFDD